MPWVPRDGVQAEPSPGGEHTHACFCAELGERRLSQVDSVCTGSAVGIHLPEGAFLIMEVSSP